MKNQTLWQGIASDLENEIVAGSLARGSRLPTESMLSQRYGVNRHTIRKALSHLAEKSLIWSKRGSGVFVMQKPTIYSMGERVRFSQNLLDAGLNLGLDLPFACKGGVCSTCKAMLVEGEVEMDIQRGLTADEIARGMILTCQSHPITEHVHIDFDKRWSGS